MPAPRRRDRPLRHAPEDIVPGIPRYYATTMPFRRSAYGLIVESHEGRPTKIEGNPSHPSTLGASSSAYPGVDARPLRSRPLAVATLQGGAKSWSDFVTAWGELAKAHAADGGAGLAILSESFSSPTLARLASELRARYPRAGGRRTTPSATRTVSPACGPRPAANLDVSASPRSGRGDPRPRLPIRCSPTPR